MRADRCARREQLLGDDIAFEKALLAAAVALWPGHADPALGAEPAAEIGGAVRAEVAVWAPQPGAELVGDKAAHLTPQRLTLGRQIGGIETEYAHRVRTIQARQRSCQRSPAGKS